MKIAFLSSVDFNLYFFRFDIMKELISRGDEVFAIIPRGKYTHLLEEIGVTVIDYKISRSSLNPFSSISTILELIKILKKLKPDLLHTFTVKPNIFGGIAGKIAGVPKIYNLIEGLGSFYVDNSLKSKIIRKVIETLYKISIKFADLVIFVNRDDPQYLINKNILPQEKAKIILSVGVDTKEFSTSSIEKNQLATLKKSLNISENKIVIIMIARATIHKGTPEYFESAKILKQNSPIKDKLEFLFVGDIDEGNPFSLSKEFLEKNSDFVKFLGWRKDVKELIAISNIVVLPSHREGVPRTLLEACSMSKPIVATDVVGCRETVENGKNGFLVPVKSPEILAEKIHEIALNPELSEKMGKHSRYLAETIFDIKNITKQYLKLY